MSIHAQLNPEALARLQAQKRNSAIASIIVGILLMTLLGLIFWLIGIKIFSKQTEPIVSYSPDEVSEEVVEKVKVTNAVKKTPASPSSSASPVIAAAAPSAFAVPTPEVFVDSPAPEFGESEGFGDGFGDGNGSGFGGGGGGFTALPASMRKRCSPAERLQRVKATGGNEKCEEAVVKSLTWMKSKQKS